MRSLRAKTFKNWFDHNLKEYAGDIANHGADCGYPYITYTRDTVRLFDRYGSAIWEMAVEDAESMGHRNVAEMLAEFRRTDMMDDLDRFKNLMVWYACEKLARDLEDAREARRG